MERGGGLFPFHPHSPFPGTDWTSQGFAESDDELELKDELEGDDGLELTAP
jgi:hypothetical protein